MEIILSDSTITAKFVDFVLYLSESSTKRVAQIDLFQLQFISLKNDLSKIDKSYRSRKGIKKKIIISQPGLKIEHVFSLGQKFNSETVVVNKICITREDWTYLIKSVFNEYSKLIYTAPLKVNKFLDKKLAEFNN